MSYLSRNYLAFINIRIANMQVNDRAQVFISCSSEGMGARPTYVGTVERWLNKKLSLPEFQCHSNINLYILVYTFFNVFLFLLVRKNILEG